MSIRFSKMKVFLVIVSIAISISVVGAAYVLQPAGVDGQIEIVNFDSEGNVYAVRVTNIVGSTRSNHTFHKVSPDNEHLWSIQLPSWLSLVFRMRITKQNDIYLYFYSNVYPDDNNTLAILRSGSQTVDIIEEIYGSLFFLDDNDNLYYNRKSGVHILRPGSTTAIQIKNLENFNVKNAETAVTDSEGNVYFAVTNTTQYHAIALITKEELGKEIPEAKFWDAVELSSQYVVSSIIDPENNLWVFIRDLYFYQGVVKKFENGIPVQIAQDYKHVDIFGRLSKDRIYVVEANQPQPVAPRVFYVTLDKQVVTIPELENLPEQQYFAAAAVADQNGTGYFKSYRNFSEELGSMFIIKSEEDKPIPVRLEDPKDAIDDIFIDLNEDVWLISNPNQKVYYIKKGETVANKIETFVDTCEGVYSNLVTKKVYVACVNRLYVAVSEE